MRYDRTGLWRQPRVRTQLAAQGLQVIGAGFGRTGTLSLKKALETLGFDKCYHMAEVAAHAEHTALWRAAWRGEEPWRRLFEGYAAAVDWPAAAFWPQLMAVYPQAKVILTVRDAESWYASAQRTIFQSMKDGLRATDPERRERLRMATEIIVEGTFGGDLDDKANAIAVYEANVARAREVPAERLIVFDPRDGWQPLCRAFDLPVPDEPYPRINTTEEFIERWRGGNPNRALREGG